MSDNRLAREVTRRSFLKASAVTAAVVAMGDKLFGGPVSTLLESAAAAAPAVTEDKWFPTTCYLCSNNCGMLAHRVNGVAIKLDGNPAHPTNKGKLCARGNAGLMKMYNPWRVKAPMKRTNPEKGRGIDPKWQEISWDEAINVVGEKMGKIHATDPRKLVYLEGWGIRLYGGSGRSQVGGAFGTPNWMSGPGGMTCYAGIHNLGYIINGTSTACGADWAYCNYHLTIGSSVGLNKSDTKACREFFQAKERGMKFVTVDTKLDKEGVKADEWVPIRGGTDLAFLMALLNVMLYEIKKFDVDFVKQRTNGPYLIRSDNGLYARSSTEMLKADPTRINLVLGKPYVWDAKENKAKVFDDPSIKDYALEGTFTVEGVECRPAFDLMKRQMKDYAPEWAEKITTVPAATTRRIAQELLDAAQIGSTIEVDGVTFPYRPVAVDIGRGGNTHKFGALAVQATHLVDMLLGSAETPGGNVVNAKQATGVDGVNLVTDRAVYKKIQYPPDYDLMTTYWPISYKAYWATHDAFLNPEKYGIKYKPDMLLLAGANPIFGFGSPDFVTESLKTFPFIVTISYHFDEPAELADIVLPDPGYTEWLQDTGGALRQPLLDKPLYNSKKPEEIFIELADKGGYLSNWNKYLNDRWLRLKDPYKLDLNKKYTQEEILDRALRSKYGDQYGLEWFKVNGIAPQTPAPEKENYGYNFNPKTRYPLYFEHLKWTSQQLAKDLAAVGATHPYPDWQQSYDPLPQWRANPTYDSAPEFDLFENNYRTSLMSMGFSPDNPWTYECMEFDPYPGSVWINKETAKKKGLKDGDLVWVESFVQEPWSKVKGEVFTSEAVHPDGCIIGGQWGRWAVGMNPISKERAHHNSLLSIKLQYVDHFSGNIQMGSKVKIYKV